MPKIVEVHLKSSYLDTPVGSELQPYTFTVKVEIALEENIDYSLKEDLKYLDYRVDLDSV